MGGLAASGILSGLRIARAAFIAALGIHVGAVVRDLLRMQMADLAPRRLEQQPSRDRPDARLLAAMARDGCCAFSGAPRTGDCREARPRE